MENFELEKNIVLEDETEVDLIPIISNEEQHAIDEFNEEVFEAESVDPSVQVAKKRCVAKPKFPPPPTYTPFVHARPYHSAFARLPRSMNMSNLSPMSIFSLFFNDEQLETMLTNTNEYAAIHFAGVIGRPWKKTNCKELKVWIALVIYQGLHKESSIDDYWNLNPKGAIHEISNFMTLGRFEQIKRFFHVCRPLQENKNYYDKVEPLMSHVHDKSKELYVPSSNVSVDEMIIQFSGRSGHTVRIKGKPIPEGYKIISLCDSGYTYSFVATSRIEKYDVESIPGVNYTGALVYHLVKQLPYQSRSFDVYMDNYFSSIPLFAYLKSKKIGACGTVRRSTVLKKLKIEQNITRIDWDTRSGFKENGVLAVFWQDNGPVTMLTTIHRIVGENSEVPRIRRKPRITSTNGAKVAKVFGKEYQKELMIPKVIDDYNHNMNGVDLADQRRSYYGTHQATRRNWMPLFFWLLDTAIINSFLLAKVKRCKLSHKQFRHELIWELIYSANESGVSLRSKQAMEKEKKSRVTKNFVLSEKRFMPLPHLPEWREKRVVCIWCSWTLEQTNVENKNNSVCKTYTYCEHCNVPLCYRSDKNCFSEYHKKK